jgi:hypothetical protein
MAKDIPSEKPLLDKLGVKPGVRTAVIGIDDARFLAILRERAEVTVGVAPEGVQMVFLGVEGPADMRQLHSLRDKIARDGAVWVVNPKGNKLFNSSHVMALGLETGMVDVKIARFSETQSATKFVIRKKDR